MHQTTGYLLHVYLAYSTGNMELSAFPASGSDSTCSTDYCPKVGSLSLMQAVPRGQPLNVILVSANLLRVTVSWYLGGWETQPQCCSCGWESTRCLSFCCLAGLLTWSALGSFTGTTVPIQRIVILVLHM